STGRRHVRERLELGGLLRLAVERQPKLGRPVVTAFGQVDFEQDRVVNLAPQALQLVPGTLAGQAGRFVLLVRAAKRLALSRQRLVKLPLDLDLVLPLVL